MILYVLNIKPSLRPVSETKLTRYGIWMEGFDPSEAAYEMCIDIYPSTQFGYLDLSPDRTIIIGEEYYREILEKYSTDELSDGIKIDSILSILNPLSLDKELLFEEEVRVIAHNILDAKTRSESDGDFLFTIEQEIRKLKNKFKISPK